jgi:hypothetical protein
MPAFRAIRVFSACVVLVGGWSGELFAQGTGTFRVNIPLKNSPEPIGLVKATVGLSSSVTPITFTFKDQLGTIHSTTCAPACVPSQLSFSQETFSSGPDQITITQTSGPDPLRYEIDFYLSSNHGTPTNTNSCANAQQVDPNTYDVTISGGNKIVGVCLESFDWGTSSVTAPNSCTNAGIATREIPIPIVGVDKVATVDTLTPPPFACFKARPPVDVVMVLDKSGSMATTDPGSSSTRMGALHSAVTTFLEDWANLSPPNDNVGIVTFDTAATVRTALEDVVTNKSAIETDITNNVNPGGSTSIGGGLVAANPALSPQTGRRKVVLLMSDGQQNTDPFVQSDTRLYCANSADPLCVSPVGPSCTMGASACLLPNTPQIYTVTIGPSTTVDPAINFQIANATLGFYLNSETNPTLLSPFFLELLQNFVRFNSYETVRLISENVTRTAPYSATLPLSTTSHDAVFSLMWPSQLGALRLTVTPPGGAQPIVKESASGFISLVQTLPLPAPFDPTGDWKILVEAIDVAGAAVLTTGGSSGVPFNFHVMTDDAGIKTELSVVPGDYKPGDSIRLRAKVRYFGLPTVGLGPHPGDKIMVDLIKPGQSIGDMLSDSTASATPSSPDIDPGAEAKLYNTLQNNPGALKHVSDSIQLFDDGKPEHGDDVAGDGIYSALYPATLPGHYNFLFSVESTDPNSIRFSRQQLRTAYVRSVPDAGNTVFQTSIFRRDNGNVLSIVMTPRVKPGPGCSINNPKCGRMGPGWANYFWFTAPGQTPFKAKDNLDGTYTATLAFAGSAPPPVLVHFENVLAVIVDSVPPDKLPDPLGQGNVLTVVPPPNGGAGRVAVFLDAGANIPQGTFGSVFNEGFSVNGGLEYIATSHFSVEGIFGYHHFPAKIGSDLNLYQFSVNGKTYLTTGALRPFVKGGIGAYKFSPGPTKFGGNFGAGLLYNLTPRFGLEGAYNFHVVNTSGAATKFSTLQAGIRLVF